MGKCPNQLQNLPLLCSYNLQYSYGEKEIKPALDLRCGLACTIGVDNFLFTDMPAKSPNFANIFL